jgi:hypothetical protein
MHRGRAPGGASRLVCMSRKPPVRRTCSSRRLFRVSKSTARRKTKPIPTRCTTAQFGLMERVKMQRPKEFDAKVMAYLPALKKLARKLTNTKTSRRACAGHAALRVWRIGRTSAMIRLRPRTASTIGLRSTCVLSRRASVKERTQQEKTCLSADEIALTRRKRQPRQEDITYANQIVRRLSRSRDGRMLVRIGGGEKLKEIGKRAASRTERVRQLTERARERLVKAVAALMLKLRDYQQERRTGRLRLLVGGAWQSACGRCDRHREEPAYGVAYQAPGRRAGQNCASWSQPMWPS